MVIVRVQIQWRELWFFDSKSDPVIFLSTRDPAGVATFWRPAMPERPRDPANPDQLLP